LNYRVNKCFFLKNKFNNFKKFTILKSLTIFNEYNNLMGGLMTNNVYITSSAIPCSFTSAPPMNLQQMFIKAGRRAIEKARISKEKINTVCIGTMGGFTDTPSETGAYVCSELGLNPYRISQEKDTSSTGASALFTAFQDISSGSQEENYVLVIAGEQMFPAIPKGQKRTDKIKQILKAQSLKNTAVISGVIGFEDRQYGLTMPLIGDMLEKELMRISGFNQSEWLDTIFPAMRKAKLLRGQAFKAAHFYKKEFSLEKFINSPSITPIYKRDTMVPQSSGAVALILSNRPPEPVNGKVVRIRSVGQGFTSSHITKRPGPLWFPNAISNALFQLCKRGGLSVENIKNASCRFDHDAFKAIERSINFCLGETEKSTIENMLSGYNNPFGGLEICGHAIGASGLLHIAQAHMLATNDTDYIDTDHIVVKKDFKDIKSIICSSVGAALTNLFLTYLEVASDDKDFVNDNNFDEQSFNKAFPVKNILNAYNEKVKSCELGPETGIIIASTRPNMNLLEFSSDFDVTVNLIETASGKVFALSQKDLSTGDKVKSFLIKL
jgi:acetyl-CoA acetyltransferase